MNRTIEVKDKLYALVTDAKELPKLGTSEWYGKSYEQLQGSRMNYPRGKSFKTHKHIMNPRTIKRTQECFVVISGEIQIDIYEKVYIKKRLAYSSDLVQEDSHVLLGTLMAKAGEALFVYDGFHKLSVLEDAVFYEIKSGAYTSVDEDKEFLPEVD